MSMYGSESDLDDPGRLRHPITERFACLDCPWKGKGYTERSAHYWSTKHKIVSAGDTRLTPSPERKAG